MTATVETTTGSRPPRRASRGTIIAGAVGGLILLAAVVASPFIG